jgi:CHAT domain-containing protein
MNLDSIESVWQTGRDARTCPQAQLLAIVYQRAIPQLEARLEKFGRESLGVLKTTVFLEIETAIADALSFSGRYADAEQFLKERATKFINEAKLRAPKRGDPRIQKGENDRRASLLERLAALYVETRPDEAERLYQQTIGREKIEWRKAEGAWQRGEYEREAAAKRARILGPYYESTGRHREALALHEAARALYQAYRDGIPEGSRRYIGTYEAEIRELDRRIMLDKARIAVADGRLEAAEDLYRRCCFKSSRQISEEGVHGPETRLAIPEFARMLLARGRQAEARRVALRLRLEVASDLADEFECMTVAAKASGQAAIAQAQRAARDAYSEDWDEIQIHERGGVSRGRGSYVGQAAMVPRVGGLLAEATELGILLIECGLLEDGYQVLRVAFSLQETIFGSSHPNALRALAGLADVERRLGRTASAAESWSTWIGQSNAFIADRLWDVSEDARRGFLRTDRTNLGRALATLLAAGRPDAAAQVLAVSVGRKGLLARLASEVGLLARGARDPATRRLVTELVQQRQHLAGLVGRDQSGTQEAALARRKLNDLQVQLAAALRSGRPAAEAVTPHDLLQAIPPEGALVDFLVFHDPDAGSGSDPYGRMVAVIARRQGDPVLVSWPAAGEVQAAAAALRGAILGGPEVQRSFTQAHAAESGHRDQEIAAATDTLYARLWAPLEPHLQGVKHVDLVPDGFLNVVPLRALRDRQGRYLIQRFELGQLGSARDLSAGAVAERHATALVVGAPDYGQLASARDRDRGGDRSRTVGRGLGELRFSALPGALEESKQVATILSGKYASALLTGPRATKGAVLHVDGPAILHLATHGFFLADPAGSSDEGDPLRALSRSGLALASANRSLRPGSSGAPPDGILTALEALSMDLRGTRLVVLSACDTGLGQVEVGEGVHGLARAFHEAGSRAVLATLWPVADQATAEFMKRLYRRIVAGQSLARALDDTQIEMLQTPEWRDPKFWAPFALTGR